MQVAGLHRDDNAELNLRRRKPHAYGNGNGYLSAARRSRGLDSG